MSPRPLMLSSLRSWGALLLGGVARADLLCYVMLCERAPQLEHGTWRLLIRYRRRWWVHQDLAPALPTRVAIEQAMFHGRLRTERDSYTAPRAAPRAR